MITYDPEQKRWIVDERLENWERTRLVLVATLGELVLACLPTSDQIKKIKEHEKRKPS